jgi:hypothetical protein
VAGSERRAVRTDPSIAPHLPTDVRGVEREDDSRNRRDGVRIGPSDENRFTGLILPFERDDRVYQGRAGEGIAVKFRRQCPPGRRDRTHSGPRHLDTGPARNWFQLGALHRVTKLRF